MSVLDSFKKLLRGGLQHELQDQDGVFELHLAPHDTLAKDWFLKSPEAMWTAGFGQYEKIYCKNIPEEPKNFRLFEALETYARAAEMQEDEDVFFHHVIIRINQVQFDYLKNFGNRIMRLINQLEKKHIKEFSKRNRYSRSDFPRYGLLPDTAIPEGEVKINFGPGVFVPRRDGECADRPIARIQYKDTCDDEWHDLTQFIYYDKQRRGLYPMNVGLYPEQKFLLIGGNDSLAPIHLPCIKQGNTINIGMFEGNHHLIKPEGLEQQQSEDGQEVIYKIPVGDTLFECWQLKIITLNTEQYRDQTSTTTKSHEKPSLALPNRETPEPPLIFPQVDAAFYLDLIGIGLFRPSPNLIKWEMGFDTNGVLIPETKHGGPAFVILGSKNDHELVIKLKTQKPKILTAPFEDFVLKWPTGVTTRIESVADPLNHRYFGYFELPESPERPRFCLESGREYALGRSLSEGTSIELPSISVKAEVLEGRTEKRKPYDELYFSRITASLEVIDREKLRIQQKSRKVDIYIIRDGEVEVIKKGESKPANLQPLDIVILGPYFLKVSVDNPTFIDIPRGN